MSRSGDASCCGDANLCLYRGDYLSLCLKSRVGVAGSLSLANQNVSCMTVAENVGGCGVEVWETRYEVENDHHYAYTVSFQIYSISEP